MTVKLRLYPTEEQEAVMNMHCSHARFVWNLGLEQRNYWRKGMNLPPCTVNTQCKSLTEARQDSWLSDGSTMVQQQALRDLDQAFKNWWSNPGHFGRPTWRKASGGGGFRVVEIQFRKLNNKWGEVRVPKCGWIKFRLTKDFETLSECKSARFRKDSSGRWFTSFALPQPAVEKTATGKSLGIDMGVTQSVTTSDGEHYSMPLPSANEKARRLRLERKISKQVMGSNRRNLTKLKLAKLIAKDADRRKDWIEKMTTQLVKENDLMALERLDIIRMVKSTKGTVEKPGKSVKQKSNLNRMIQEQSWGLFRERLTDKSEAATIPTKVILVNPAFTSQCCHRCGYIDEKNRENQATFKCLKCDYADNADVNAAKNILSAGLAV